MTSSLSPTPSPLTVHDADANGIWLVEVEADGTDPLVLTRVLQKFALPSSELLGVTFRREAATAHISLRVRCAAAWMRLLREKIARLPAVRSQR